MEPFYQATFGGLASLATLKPARKARMTRISLAVTPGKLVRQERNASTLTATEDPPVPIAAVKADFGGA
jgi:hypothetical protein